MVPLHFPSREISTKAKPHACSIYPCKTRDALSFLMTACMIKYTALVSNLHIEVWGHMLKG